jgi:hypothetical protein
MSIKLLPDLTNVVRFPVEQRVVPSIQLVFEIAPDCRDIERLGEAFHLELPPRDLHHRVDAETAIHIAGHVLPLVLGERRRALDALLRPVVTRAVDACRQADGAGRRAAEAQARLVRAQAAHGAWSWLSSLEEQADAAALQAAELLVLAHRRCQEARGVARAVGFARRSEPWTPFDLHVATESLLADERHHQARAAVQGG